MKKQSYYKLDELVEATKSYLQERLFSKNPNAFKGMEKIFRSIEAEERSISEKDVTEISLSTLEKAPLLGENNYQQVVAKAVIYGIQTRFVELGYKVIEK